MSIVRVIVFIVFVVFSILGCQKEEKSSREIFERYEGKEGAVRFNVPPGLITLFMDPEISKELDKLMKHVDKFKVLSIKKKSFKSSAKISVNEEFDTVLKENDFEDIIMFSSGSRLIKLKIRENRQYADELVIIMTDPDLFFAVGMEGKIGIDKILNLTKNIQPRDLIDAFLNSINKN